MTMWRMQYRTRGGHEGPWGDWADLPESLVFSDYYLPKQFEFRAVMSPPAPPAFRFEGNKMDGP